MKYNRPHATARWGTMAKDWELGVDYARLNRERAARAQASVKASGLGAVLCFNVDNVLTVLATMLAWGIPFADAASALSKCRAPSGRMEVFGGRDPHICGDGAGGALIGWQTNRYGNQDIYLRRVLASGVMAPGWPGIAMATAGSVPTVW